MAAFETRRLGPFNGLNEDENPHALNPNDLIDGLNVTHRGSTLGTRPGTRLEATTKEYENATTGDNDIQGLHEHRENIDAERNLLAVGSDGSTQNVFFNDAQLLPNLATITAGQDNVWTFANHNNRTYAAGGHADDDFWQWNGATGTGATRVAALDSAATALRPKYTFAWRNYLFIGGLRGGVLSDNNTSLVRFADFGSDTTLAASWSDGNTIGFTAFGKSFNTGMSEYQDNSGSFLLLLQNDHIQTVLLDPTSGFNVPFFINDKVANGCVSQRAYVNLGVDAGDGIYLSEKGIHTLRQSQEHGTKADSFISWKIRPTFGVLNRDRLQYAVGAYDFRNGRVLFLVTTGSNTSHDLILSLDVKGTESITADNANWTIWRIDRGTGVTARFINELKMLRDEDNVWRMYFGTTIGEVGYFDDEVFSDFGRSYTSRFQTAHNAHGSVASNKNLGDITVTLQPGGNYTPSMRFYFDYGNRVSTVRSLTMPAPGGGQWGTAQWGTSENDPGAGQWAIASVTRDEKVYGSGSGKTIGFSVEHSTAAEPFFVSTIDYQVRSTGEDMGDVASGT